MKFRLSARARGGQRHGGLRDGAKVVKYGGYMSGRLVGRGFGYRRRSVQGLSKTPGAATCKLCRNSRHSRRLDKGSDRVWPGLVSSQDGGEREEGRIRGRAVLVSVLLASDSVARRLGTMLGDASWAMASLGEGGATSPTGLTQAVGRQTGADGTCEYAV
jgi:hypothetical protein